VNKQQLQQEALNRATTNSSVRNYGLIFSGFAAKGIPEADIKPRENVLTYQAWRAIGQQVCKGEKGVKVCTVLTTSKDVEQDDGTIKTEHGRRPWAATVFHVSQTKEG
jgi:antirestriction protein ArdC